MAPTGNAWRPRFSSFVSRPFISSITACSNSGTEPALGTGDGHGHAASYGRHRGEQFFRARACGMQAHLARLRAVVLEGDLQPIPWKRTGRAIRPFAERRGGLLEEIIESQREELGLIGDPIQVQVLEWHRAAVPVEQREAGRAGWPGAGPFGDGF